MTDSAATLATAAPALATPEQVREATLREAEANLIASLANSVTAVFGISGAGKSNLADTACEYNWEVHGGITFCYALDPGGFGTKRLALIKAGIMRVWRPGNHQHFFETMELCSMGGWPEHVIDPETGYADPSVRIVMPRSFRYVMICPQGHAGRVFHHELSLNSMGPVPQPCSECGMMYASGNCLRIDRQLVRNSLFKNVTLRIFDSISAESDQGLILELPTMSAKGTLPKGQTGGSALGSADALESGSITYGTGSMAQVGFMQNRAYGWLTNIGKIPDQKTPPVCIFGVEQSKDDDETGGLIVLGPRIAGKARTGSVPGWVGNCLHAVQEPDARGNMRFRLYLRTHVDAKDPRKIPYLAKHRGVPRDMPDFLEDPWDDDPKVRAEKAWTVCSLNVLFRMIDAQVLGEVERLRAKYPNAPGFAVGGAGDQVAEDEVIETFAPRVASAMPGTPGGGAVPLGVPQMAQGPGPAAAGTTAGQGAAGTAPAPMMVGGAPVATRRRAAPQAVANAPAPAVQAPPVPQVATLPVPVVALPPFPVPVTVTPPVVAATVTPDVQPPAVGAMSVPAPTDPVRATPSAAEPVPPSSAIPSSPAPAAAGEAASTTGAVPTAVAPAAPVAAAPPPTPGPDVITSITGPVARRRPRPPV